MRQLLSEILKFVEFEYVNDGYLELGELATPCSGGPPINYTAVDSGYAVQRFRNTNVLIQSLVAVGREVRRRVVVKRVEDPHRDARLNEINFAEEVEGLVLLDGPLTPYRAGGHIVGVSKGPAEARYGPNMPHGGARSVFIKMSKLWGESATAASVLSRWPRGSYLKPVEVGGYYGTYLKSDWVIYVEYPKSLKIEDLCRLFVRYPIKLRLAHHLSKMNKKYLNSVKFLLWTIGRNQIHPKDLL